MAQFRRKNTGMSDRKKWCLVAVLSVALGYVLFKPSKTSVTKSAQATLKQSPANPESTRKPRHLALDRLPKVELNELLDYNPFEFSGKKPTRKKPIPRNAEMKKKVAKSRVVPARKQPRKMEQPDNLLARMRSKEREAAEARQEAQRQHERREAEKRRLARRAAHQKRIQQIKTRLATATADIVIETARGKAVRIDGRIYQAGDTLPDGTIVRKIGPEEIELELPQPKDD